MNAKIETRNRRPGKAPGPYSRRPSPVPLLIGFRNRWAPLRLRPEGPALTDGVGLVALRQLWDRLDLGRWLRARTGGLPGHYGSPLMVELWIVLLVYGGGWLDDLRWLRRRQVRRLFGWMAIPDPTTFGRWLRRCGEALTPLRAELGWHLVRIRWKWTSVPKAVTLVVDSTVILRYGLKQAGAEVDYNPRKPGRPSHHPLLAFLLETGDLVGLKWRPGSANTAAGAVEWIIALIERLREAGVEEITVRLDKGFFSKELPRRLDRLGVHFFLKVPNHGWLRDHRGPWRLNGRAQGAFSEAEEVYSAAGELWGFRLVGLQGRRPLKAEEGTLELDTYEVTDTAHILTNVPGIHALTAWRRYNAGAVVEQRIKEFGQLSAGQTAIDDLDGNRLLWALGGVAYQLLHILRTTALGNAWRTAQPKRIRAWMVRMPGRFTSHSGQLRLHFHDPDGWLDSVLVRLGRLRARPEFLAA